MKLVINGRDFTSLCVRLVLEDNIYAAASVLYADIVFENHDGYLPPVFACCGDEVVLSEGAEIFRGSVTAVNVTGKRGLFRVSAMEKSHLLAKNDVFGLFSSSAAANARKAIGQAGLSVGSLPGKACRSFASYGGMTAKAVIDACYGEGYFVEYTGDRVNVVRLGEGETALSGSRIFSIDSEASIEDMVNFVSLTDSKHSVIYNTKSNSDIDKYGKYHKYYQISRNENGSDFAKGKLTGLRNRAEIVLAGEFGLKKGRCVEFDLVRYGLEGRYVIESVRHEVERGLHLTAVEVRLI